MPLRRMTLRNFVIVESLEIEFQEGFTVLTGETGAGKSILIDALQLVLGARADVGMVRTGAARTDLSAEFDAPGALTQWLEEGGFSHEDGLLLRRVVETSGKSRGWINGSPATAAQLRDAGAMLVDIHGQHAWQNLTRTGAVRQLLDHYAGASAQPVGDAWEAWRASMQAVQRARDAQVSARADRERLQWQIAELDKLAPRAGEWSALNEEHTRLGHAQTLLEAAQLACDRLEGEDGGARSALAQARDALASQEHLEPMFRELCTLLNDGLAQADEALRGLHAYLRRDALDAQQLQILDERVALWMALARRFKQPPAELPGLLQDWKAQLNALDAGTDLDALAATEAAAQRAYESAAQALARQRKRAAPRLAAAVTQLLQSLGMAGGVFEVRVGAAPQPSSHGQDEVEFLVAGHAGQPPRPIGKVASGGELSRIALAVAVTTSALGSADTLIFDEVDSGVGGAVAETVGRLMQRLGERRQVLAVTHLPQVAACAGRHLVVSKLRTAAGATSTVLPAEGSERLAEVARMLGGEKTSQAGLAHAREMLAHSESPGEV